MNIKKKILTLYWIRSINWNCLREHFYTATKSLFTPRKLIINLPLEEIARVMTMAGLEVDEVKIGRAHV